MLKFLPSILLAALLCTACSDRRATTAMPDAASNSATEITGLKAQIARLQQENTELRATPAALLAAVRAAGNNMSKADEANEILGKKFPDSIEAKQANTLLAQMKSDNDKREAEAKRLAALGFKALKVGAKLAGDEASITLSGVNQTKRWISDAYDSQYHYRDSEKGSAFIVARVKVTSNNKNPSLPGVALYRSEGATLKRVANFGYEFGSWKDYGSYLGNYSDYGNDFAHTNAILMSIGADAELSALTRPLFLVATKEGCYSRNYERFRNPPVSYVGGNCSSLKEALEISDFSDGRLALVHRLD